MNKINIAHQSRTCNSSCFIKSLYLFAKLLLNKTFCGEGYAVSPSLAISLNSAILMK